MKKFISIFLVLTLIISVAIPTFASEPADAPVIVEYNYPIEEATPNDYIMPIATQVLSYNLGPGEYATSAGTYYVSNEDSMLEIIAASWDPQDADLQIGWYNVRTGVIYIVSYTGGCLNNQRINSVGLVDGTYRIIVKNVSSLDVIGSMTYSVD